MSNTPCKASDPYPARLHVLLASGSHMAVVIRRGPSQQVATIGWDRKTDTFFLGQWLKGRIYEYNSDISPDGKHFLYHAMGAGSYKTWTVISKTPYLKALDFYPDAGPWSNGGLFESNITYWLSEKDASHCEYKNSRLRLSTSPPRIAGLPEERYFHHDVMRLIRDGWKCVFFKNFSSKEPHFAKLRKQINAHWELVKLKHYNLSENKILSGKAAFYETHQLISTSSNETIDLPNWEWADIDRNRIVWAEEGKLMSAHANKEGLYDIKELHDFNDMAFEAVVAPY